MVKLIDEGLDNHTIQELANIVTELRKQGKSREEIFEIINKLLDD